MRINDPHKPRFPRLRYIYIYIRSALAMRRASREVLADLQHQLDPTNIDHVAIWNMAVLDTAQTVGSIEHIRELNGCRPMSYKRNKAVVRGSLGHIMVGHLADLNR